jgi:hypothetical protein
VQGNTKWRSRRLAGDEQAAVLTLAKGKNLQPSPPFIGERERGLGWVPLVGDGHRRRARIGDKEHASFSCHRVSDWWAVVRILNVARIWIVTGSHCFEPNPLTSNFLYFPNELNYKLENPPLCFSKISQHLHADRIEDREQLFVWN